MDNIKYLFICISFSICAIWTSDERWVLNALYNRWVGFFDGLYEGPETGSLLPAPGFSHPWNIAKAQEVKRNFGSGESQIQVLTSLLVSGAS